MGEGTTENQLGESKTTATTSAASRPNSSYKLGETVPLKIGTDEPSFPATNVNIAVYRIGYYGGDGARLIPARVTNNVPVNNSFECNPRNTTHRRLSCSNWNVSYTIPGNKLPVSGIYEAVFTDAAVAAIENYVVFPVRNDIRASAILFVLPSADVRRRTTCSAASRSTSTLCGGANTISGDPRAVAVSFDRPRRRKATPQLNHFFGPDFLHRRTGWRNRATTSPTQKTSRPRRESQRDCSNTRSTSCPGTASTGPRPRSTTSRPRAKRG